MFDNVFAGCLPGFEKSDLVDQQPPPVAVPARPCIFRPASAPAPLHPLPSRPPKAARTAAPVPVL
eukprot:2815389-Amphidinium_carterae.1